MALSVVKSKVHSYWRIEVVILFHKLATKVVSILLAELTVINYNMEHSR